MLKFFTLSLITFTALSLPLSFAQASELTIKPGLWQTTTTTTKTTAQSLQDQTHTQITEECVTDTSFKPVEMIKDIGECKVIRDEVSDNTSTFQMTCFSEEADFTVNGEYTAERGTMDVSMSMRGMDLEMNIHSTFEHIRDC